MASESDSSRGAGRSWKSFFGVKDKEGAEKRMTELEYTWVWLEGMLPASEVSPPPSPIYLLSPLLSAYPLPKHTQEIPLK
jgi:hypothetical protein